MTGHLYYEPDPTSETELKGKSLIPFDEDCPMNHMGAIELGVFWLTPQDVLAVLECALLLFPLPCEAEGLDEKGARRVREANLYWENQRLGFVEFYPRVLSALEQDQPVAGRFEWSLLAPVYSAERLVAGALELGRGEARCKVCQRDYQGADLDTLDWSWPKGAKMGSEYVCPSDHVLLRTQQYMHGSILGDPYGRYRRERIPGKCFPDQIA